MNLYKYLMEEFNGTIEMNKSFKDLTTIGCGGTIEYFTCPDSIESLAKFYKDLNEIIIKYFILGNGSNVLAHDEFFMVLLFHLKIWKSILKLLKIN